MLGSGLKYEYGWQENRIDQVYIMTCIVLLVDYFGTFALTPSEFSKWGWMLELQAPQGPYTNALDLQVFHSMMSKKHSELLQIYSNSEADKDRIWKIATEIWNTMSSSMVARAFLLAYRIMEKIIKTNGDTEWLSHGAPHCNVRKDYVDTDRGVKKIQDVVEVEENEQESFMCY